MIGLDDPSTGFASNLVGMDGKVEFVEGSILDQPLVDRLIFGADAVVHLAARPSVPRSIEDPMVTDRSNVDGTVGILEAVRKQLSPPHVIFASSSSVYGANPSLPKHEDLATLPRSPNAASKLTAFVSRVGVAAILIRSLI